MTVPRRAVLTAGGVLAALALLAGCSGSGDDAAPGTLTVVTSTNVWGAVASAVAGPGRAGPLDHLRPRGRPPLLREHPRRRRCDRPGRPRRRQRRRVRRVRRQGHRRRTRPTKAKTIEAFDLRPDRADDNEHVWFDPTTVKAVAGQVADRLSATDPSKAAGLHQRAPAFDAQVDRIAAQTAAIGRAKPGTQVFSTEPIAHYLLRTAGVTDATPPDFVAAIENETDPSAASLVQVGDALSARRVSALVFNPQTETPVVQGLRDRGGRRGGGGRGRHRDPARGRDRLPDLGRRDARRARPGRRRPVVRRSTGPATTTAGRSHHREDEHELAETPGAAAAVSLAGAELRRGPRTLWSALDLDIAARGVRRGPGPQRLREDDAAAGPARAAAALGGRGARPRRAARARQLRGGLHPPAAVPGPAHPAAGTRPGRARARRPPLGTGPARPRRAPPPGARGPGPGRRPRLRRRPRRLALRRGAAAAAGRPGARRGPVAAARRRAPALAGPRPPARGRRPGRPAAPPSTTPRWCS